LPKELNFNAGIYVNMGYKRMVLSIPKIIIIIFFAKIRKLIVMFTNDSNIAVLPFNSVFKVYKSLIISYSL